LRLPLPRRGYPSLYSGFRLTHPKPTQASTSALQQVSFLLLAELLTC
jgi:hypothetical protein